MYTGLGDVTQLLLFTIIPAKYLYIASAVLMGVILLILTFIAFYLWNRNIHIVNGKKLKIAFSDIISEAIICETMEELTVLVNDDGFKRVQNRWLRSSFGRNYFIKELMTAKDSLSGISGTNLIWLYEYLELNQDSSRMLSSKKWFKKAIAIQELARMNQKGYLKRIYRETDNENSYIRTEAQVAMVKLIGFQGLRFMNIVSNPVTQWQQLCLIQQLEEVAIETPRVKGWLESKNATVVEFALRIVERFKSFELADDVAGCLSHPSSDVRLQAIKALKEIANDNTAEQIIRRFIHFTRSEKLLAMQLLEEFASASDLNLLTNLLPGEEECIRLKIISLIKEISPAWGKIILNVLDSESAVLNKIAV